jgi:hypothetical protein
VSKKSSRKEEDALLETNQNCAKTTHRYVLFY